MKFFVSSAISPNLPRTLAVRALAVSFALGGCVPATTYEQATSAAEVEREGHRRVAMKLADAEQELAREKAQKEALLAEKADLEARLAAEETALAKTSLDMEGAKKEHEIQLELVTQLRGELARVGDHLKAFQGDKETLSDELAASEKKVKLLEEQIEYLRSKNESSAEAQKKLEQAIVELDSMQAKQAPSEPAPEEAAEEPTAEEADSPEPEADEPTDAEPPVDEVMPENEEDQAE